MRSESLALQVVLSFVVLLSSGRVSAQAGRVTDYCDTFPRKVSLPPSNVAQTVTFRDTSPPTGVGFGNPKGFMFATTISISNIGTLNQTIRAEYTEVEYGGAISRPGILNYSPTPWVNTGMDWRARLNGSRAAGAYASFRREISLPPGQSATIRLGLECRFSNNPMTDCANWDTDGSNIRSYAGITDPAQQPRLIWASATPALRICVKGPTGKDALGAVNGSVRHEIAIISIPVHSTTEVLDDDTAANLSFPILSGFGF